MTADSNEMPLYLDPFTDYGFKTLFLEPRNNDLLLGLINAVMEGIDHPKILRATLTNTDHPGFQKEKKRVVQDLECITETGTTIIVEVQLAREVDFVDRMGFYGMRAAIVKTKRGAKRYSLVPVVVVCFMNFIHRKENADVLHVAETTYRNSSTPFMDTPRYILIEVPKFHKAEADLKTSLEEWIWSMANMSRMQQPPGLAKKDTLMGHLFEEAKIGNFTEEDRKRYHKSLEESRKMKYALEYLQEEAQIMKKEALEQGLAEGRAIGLEEGRQEGRHEGQKEGHEQGIHDAKRIMAKEMIQYDISWETITKITGLTRAELEP